MGELKTQQEGTHSGKSQAYTEYIYFSRGIPPVHHLQKNSQGFDYQVRGLVVWQSNVWGRGHWGLRISCLKKEGDASSWEDTLPALLDFFQSFNASLCSGLDLSPLRNSQNIVVSVSVDFIFCYSCTNYIYIYIYIYSNVTSNIYE